MQLYEIKQLLKDLKSSIIQCQKDQDYWRADYLRKIRRQIKAKTCEYLKNSNLPHKDL